MCECTPFEFPPQAIQNIRDGVHSGAVVRIDKPEYVVLVCLLKNEELPEWDVYVELVPKLWLRLMSWLQWKPTRLIQRLNLTHQDRMLHWLPGRINTHIRSLEWWHED